MSFQSGFDSLNDRLLRTLRPVDPTNVHGPWMQVLTGTVVIGGGTVGGAGGTSALDDSGFVVGASSLTPMGAYQGGRSVASGHIAAPAMNASAMLIVAVGAGGAGGGVAQNQITGTDGNWLNVGYASGGTFLNTVPITGSINPHGVFGSMSVVGSVQVTGSINVGNLVSVVGSVGVTPLASFTVNLGSTATVNMANFADTANSAIRVNVVAGGAGGGVANNTVTGTANTALHVGYASTNAGAWPNVDGAAWMPVMFPSGFYPTVNIAGGGAGGGFATAAVYGSPAFPVYNVGTQFLTNGSLPVILLGGSTGVTQIGAPWSVVGSAGVTPLASFTVNMGSIPTVNLGLGTVNVGNYPAVQVVDVRGSLVPTQWIISGAASGQFVVAGSAPANLRNFLSAIHLISDGTADFQWMSPSGVAISGSMRLLPGAGFAPAGALQSPIVIGSQNSAIYIRALGTLNIGGIAIGWVG